MGRKLLIGISAYNEMHRIKPVVEELRQNQERFKCDIVAGDDGSTDGTEEYLREITQTYDWGMISHESNKGIGAMIRDFISYGMNNGYEVFIIVSANGKTDIKNLPRLFLPVLEGEYDYVKGSRYIMRGLAHNMPAFRFIAIPIFSAFVSLLMGKRVTDVSYLVNASRLSIYEDPDINLEQDWLDTYGLEYYILYYVMKKYRMKEVPMEIRYPDDKLSYSKIKPFTGWWLMIRPWIALRLGVKK